MGESRRRRGQGLLTALVLLLLWVGSIWLIYQHALFTATVRSARRDLVRSRALTLARSALAESRLRLIEVAARPGTVPFEAFRSGTRGPWDVTTPQAAGLAGGLVGAPHTRARILSRMPLDRTPHEVGGIVRMESTVPYGGLAPRRVTLVWDHEFKVVNLAPPRPFGKLALAVADGATLLPGDVNDRLAASGRALANLSDMMAHAARELAHQRLLVGDLAVEVQEAAAELVRLAPAQGQALPAGHPGFFGDRSDGPSRVQVLVLLDRATGGVDLDRVDLRRRLAGHGENLRRAGAAFDASSREFHARLGSARPWAILARGALEDTGRRLATDGLALGRAHRAFLDEVAGYRREVLVVGDPERGRWMEDYWTRLSTAAWDRRSFYRLQAASDLADAPIADGVLLLGGPTDLTDATIPGRKVVVVRGPLRVRNLRRAVGQTAPGLLTILVHGDVEISGEVDASVLVLAPGAGRRATLRIAPGTRLAGMLAVGPGVMVPEVTGRLEPDPAIDSGGFGSPIREDRHRVGISPDPVSAVTLDS